MEAKLVLIAALWGSALLSSASLSPAQDLNERADTWWVDASGTGLGTGTSSDPFTSISFGVSRAFVTSGDSLVVAPGTYFNEEIDFQGKSLNLRSTGGPSVTTIVARPQLDPTTPHVAARIVSGEVRVLIDGFHITGGTGSFQCTGFTEIVGGAIEACGGAALTVRNCVFEGNQAQRGGAIYARNSTLSVEDCAFLGPGTEARGEAIYLQNSEAVVEDSLFIDLHLVSPDIPRGGGALVADQSTLLLQGCTFERNATRLFGAHLWSRSGDVTIERCAFGKSTGFAGASISASGGTLRILNSSVRLARAVQSPGAGVFASGADLVIDNTVFEGNTVDGTRGGGAVAVQAGRLTITNSRFLRNSAGQGGAIATSQSTTTLVRDCYFAGNSAPNGGGAFFLSGSSATIERSVFLDNSAAPAGSGGAVHGRAVLNHCSLRGNTAGLPGGAASEGAQLYRSIAWDNLPSDLEPSVAAVDSMVGEASGALITGGIEGPPLFWSNADLHLLPGSPAIDAIKDTQESDLDGSPMDLGALVFAPSYLPEGFSAGNGTLGCVSEPNSTGRLAQLDARGSLSIDADRLILLGSGVPPQAPALMLASMTDGFQTAPSSEGPLCLGSSILRLPSPQPEARPDGTVPTWVQLQRGGAAPTNGGLAVQAGQTWFFQLWFRDAQGSSTTNTSNSVQVTLR